MTGWPVPRAAFSGKSDGDIVSATSAVISRHQLATETGEPGGGQTARLGTPLRMELQIPEATRQLYEYTQSGLRRC